MIEPLHCSSQSLNPKPACDTSTLLLSQACAHPHLSQATCASAQHRDHHNQLQWTLHNYNDNVLNNFKITVEKKGIKKRNHLGRGEIERWCISRRRRLHWTPLPSRPSTCTDDDFNDDFAFHLGQRIWMIFSQCWYCLSLAQCRSSRHWFWCWWYCLSSAQCRSSRH